MILKPEGVDGVLAEGGGGKAEDGKLTKTERRPCIL